jgi:hypothetical protein
MYICATEGKHRTRRQAGSRDDYEGVSSQPHVWS